MQTQADKPPRVFISYNPPLRERALNLADCLRADGIDAFIDLYEPSPEEGWPRWISSQIEQSDFVLIVCSGRIETFESPHEVADFSTALIATELYDRGLINEKFLPVIFSLADRKYIPSPLRGTTYYLLDGGYEALYRRLTSQPLIESPTLGVLKQLPKRKPSRETAYHHVEKGDDEETSDSVGLHGAANLQDKPSSHYDQAESRERITLRLDRKFEEFSEQQRGAILGAIRELLGTGHPVEVVSKPEIGGCLSESQRYCGVQRRTSYDQFPVGKSAKPAAEYDRVQDGPEAIFVRCKVGVDTRFAA